MTEPKEHLLDWLRDAHAMEKQAEHMLKAQASRLEHYPQLKSRIELHLEETLGQQKLLVACIQRHGSDTSTTKDVAGAVMAFGQGLGGMMMSDEVIKGSMASFAFENLEIATYTTLIAAAEAVGDADTKQVCEQILVQERAMASWLIQHLPDVVGLYLERDENDETARR